MKITSIASSCLALLIVATSALAQGVLAPPENEPFAQPPAEEAKRDAAPADPMALAKRTAEQRIRDALGEETKFDFTEVPLADVAAYVGDLHKVQIEIDTKALDDAGLGSDIPISKSLSGITLRSALRLMLKELELTYIIEDEVLQITTPERESETLVLELYPIRALLDAGWDMEAVKRIVKQHTGGDCEVLGGSLAITQSQAAHRDMFELMRKLTEAAENDQKPLALPDRPRADGEEDSPAKERKQSIVDPFQ